MKEVAQAHRGEGFDRWQGIQHVGLHDTRRMARDAARRHVEARGIGVEQRDLRVGHGKLRVIEQIACPHTDIEVRLLGPLSGLRQPDLGRLWVPDGCG